MCVCVWKAPLSYLDHSFQYEHKQKQRDCYCITFALLLTLTDLLKKNSVWFVHKMKTELQTIADIK